MDKLRTKLLITFDSMKYRNTGLFHFGKSFGNALLEQNTDLDLTYYVHPRTDYEFPKQTPVLKLSKIDKLIFLNKNKYDLVHFTDQFLRLNPLKVNSKKILTIHDLNILYESDNDQKIKTYLNKLSKKIEACNKIVTISHFVAGEVQKHFPSCANRLSVIYNGADKLLIDENHLPSAPPAKNFLFSIGMLSPKKNFHVLPTLLYNNEYELIISGIRNKDYEEQIFKEAKKYNCENRVRITGPISEKDKAWYYQNCLAFVFPSIAEGFGLPVIEAMHFGKPVFISNRTSLPEIGGDNAFCFNNFDPESMREVFVKGLDASQEENYSDRVRMHAEKFSWKNTADQYLSLYKECLNA